MKKIICYLAVGVMFVFASCGQNKSEAEMQADSIAKADSIGNEHAKAELEKARQDSLDWVNFTTPDLKCFCVHGHVKSINQTLFLPSGFKSVQIMSFDEDGKLTSHEYEDKRMKISRDSDGRIKKEVQSGEYWAGTVSIVYKYDGSGNVVEVSDGNEHGSDTYRIGENGFYSTGDGVFQHQSEEEWKTTFSYKSMDDFGNWTSCVISRKERAVEEPDENGDWPDIKSLPFKDGEPQKVTRTVTYYSR